MLGEGFLSKEKREKIFIPKVGSFTNLEEGCLNQEIQFKGILNTSGHQHGDFFPDRHGTDGSLARRDNGGGGIGE